jgi:hypothetical protein
MNLNETPSEQTPDVPAERLQQARRAAARYARPVKRKSWLQKVFEKSARKRERERRILIQQIQNELAKHEGDSQETDLLHLTLEFLGEWQLPSSPPMSIPKDIEAAKLAALAANLQSSIVHLERLAGNGEREAVELFARHALDVSSELSKIRKKNAKMLMPVARGSIFWPVLKSRCQHFDDTGKALDQTHAVILRDLDVGRDHPIQGYRVRLSDELGNLTLELLQKVWNYKSLGYVFQMPTEWRLEAMKLPNLTREKKNADRWAKVLMLVLREKFSTDDEMAEKYKNLVSRNKRVGTGTILTELRHLIKGRLRSIAGLGRHSTGTTPQMTWALGRHATIEKEKNQSLP